MTKIWRILKGSYIESLEDMESWDIVIIFYIFIESNDYLENKNIIIE